VGDERVRIGEKMAPVAVCFGEKRERKEGEDGEGGESTDYEAPVE
jgi:hypothetical protein